MLAAGTTDLAESAARLMSTLRLFLRLSPPFFDCCALVLCTTLIHTQTTCTHRGFQAITFFTNLGQNLTCGTLPPNDDYSYYPDPQDGEYVAGREL